jgi:hypothetical protein
MSLKCRLIVGIENSLKLANRKPRISLPVFEAISLLIKSSVRFIPQVWTKEVQFWNRASGTNTRKALATDSTRRILNLDWDQKAMTKRLHDRKCRKTKWFIETDHSEKCKKSHECWLSSTVLISKNDIGDMNHAKWTESNVRFTKFIWSISFFRLPLKQNQWMDCDFRGSLISRVLRCTSPYYSRSVRRHCTGKLVWLRAVPRMKDRTCGYLSPFDSIECSLAKPVCLAVLEPVGIEDREANKIIKWVHSIGPSLVRQMLLSHQMAPFTIVSQLKLRLAAEGKVWNA